MNRLFAYSGLMGLAVVLAAQAADAAATQVTNVQLNPAGSGVAVVLQTRNGDRPQVFTVSRGNTLVADIVNTQLSLPGGSGFVQNNPSTGISSIAVSQLDANSVRITVSGSSHIPSGQVSTSRNGIVLNVNAASGSPANRPAPSTVAQVPIQVPSPQLPTPQLPNTPSNVQFPNPQISIDGVPVSQSLPTSAPALPRRAIAPPVGDISVSPLDATPSSINLGTNEIVPRLVLRDAPVRDVLSLLARAAGMNVAYVGGAAPTAAAPDATGAAASTPGATPDGSVKISLDIENEPVQDVFNYVLRISGLEANRSGRTIFVGTRLPDSARNVIARTLRMNQVSASDAANFLTTQGAETQISRERVEVQTFGEGAAARTVESRTPEILALRASEGNGPLLLRGLSVSTNSRLNTITLVGEPRKIEIASSMLTQLDLRQRQVAVNVKIVDVNLLATQDLNTSFSFGVGDTFVSSDGGSAVVNFGSVRPPSNSDVTSSRLSPPITGGLYPSGVTTEPFLDAQPNAPFGTGTPQQFSSPRLNDGTIQNGTSTYPRPNFGTNSNPLQPGVTDISEDGVVTYSLPQLFQYPTRFLANLQAQVVSGNAKILTDPTLTVQEGQRAVVKLTQQVFSGVRGTGVGQFEPIINDAGLTLDVVVNRIDDNGFVTLAINPTVSVPGASVSGPSSQGNITLLQSRSLQSGQIRLRDGQTLILSGIIQDSDRTTVSKVPILGDLPIIGALFRSTNRNNQRQEVIVLVTPHVLDDSDNSTFGYFYAPGQDAQQLLRRQGVQVP